MKYLSTMNTLKTLLIKRLMLDPPFQVNIGTIYQRFFQAPLKAVHADCLELDDGTLLMTDKIVTLRIIEQ